MRILTTLLAIFAFGLHLLLGCCWHHAHAADELPGHRHAAVGHHIHLPLCCGHGHVHDCAHEHGQEHSQSEDVPAPHAPCSDPQCVYLLTLPVQIDSAQNSPLPLAVIDLQSPATDYCASTLDLAEREKSPPHLRRHLALSRLQN